MAYVCTHYTWLQLYASTSSNTELTPEQKEYQELARKFSREVIKPVAAKYDQSGEVS